MNEIVKDVNGNEYHTVRIGNQVWTVENLKTTKYNDGTPIPLVTDGNTWGNLTTSGYCWYNNNINNKEPYGALYNWYTVNTGKLAPAGWHVPTNEDWEKLCNFLGGYDVVGGKLKELGFDHWQSPNFGATNETGFSALPGGYRYDNGAFYSIRVSSNWWSATESDASSAYYRSLYYYSEYLGRYSYDKSGGFSLRLVRD